VAEPLTLEERFQILADPRFEAAMKEFHGHLSSGDGVERAVAAVTDPRAFLAGHGLELPEGTVVSITVSGDVPLELTQAEAVEPDCIGWGKIHGCLCRKQCEVDEKGKKHCTSWCL